MHYNWCLKRIQTEGEFILPEDKTELTIGRGKSNDLKCLSLYVSRNHCKILMQNGLKMLDLASANGTYINTQRILTEREIPLKDGDLIGIGTPEASDDKCFVYRLVRIAIEDEKPQIKCEAGTSGEAFRGCKEEETKQNIFSDSYESNQTLCENVTRKRVRDISEGDVASKVPRLEVQGKTSSEQQKTLSSVIPQPSIHENNNAAQSNVLYKEASSSEQQSSSNLVFQPSRFQNYNKNVCKKESAISQCANEAERISSPVESISVNVVLNQNEHTLLASRTGEPPHRKELSDRLQEKSVLSSFVPDNNIASRNSEGDSNTHSVNGRVNEPSVISNKDKACNSLKKDHDNETSWPTVVKSEGENLTLEEIIPSAAFNSVIMNEIKTDDVLIHSTMDTNTTSNEETSHSTSKFKNNAANQAVKTPSTNYSELAASDIIVISDSEDEILEERLRRVSYSQENNPEANTMDKGVKVDRFLSHELITRNIEISGQDKLENTNNAEQNLSKQLAPISTTAAAQEKQNNIQVPCSSISFQFSKDKKIYKAKPVVMLERLDPVVSKTSKIKQEESFCNYSLTEENIIEVVDDDDEFPCSQMFEEPVVIKSEPVDGDEEKVEMKPFIRCPDDDDIICISDDSDESDNEWLAKLSQQDTDLVNIAQPTLASKNIPFIMKEEKEEEKEENIFDDEESPSCVQNKIDGFENTDALVNKQQDAQVKSKKAYGKLEIIAALPMPPRRAHQRGISANEAQRIYEEQIVQKPTKDEIEHKSTKEQHKVDAEKKRTKEGPSREVRRKHSTEEQITELLEKAPSKKKRRINTVPAHISGSEKKKIADKRKELLKAISQKQAVVEKTDIPSASSRSTSVKSNAEVRIKITEKNRGAFLTETVTTNSAVKSTGGKKKISKITDNKVEEIQNKPSTNSVHSTSRNKEILSKPSTSGTYMSQKQMSKLPRIPRLAEKAAVSTKDKVEDVSSKIEASCSIADTTTNEKLLEVEAKRSETASVIRSSLKGSSSIPEKRKSVHFREDRELVQIFEIPKEQSCAFQPVGQIKDAPPPKKPYNQQQLIGSIPVEEFVHTIVSWNVRWLEEQKAIPADQPPPVHKGPLLPMLSSFLSYSDYHKIVTPLLYLELWAQISKDYETSSQRSHILVGLDEATHLPPLSPSNKQLMMLRCHAAITKEDVVRNNLPRFGDLVIFELGLESTNKTDDMEHCLSQGSGNRNYFTIIFAYVCKVSREAITGTTYFHKELLSTSSRPAAFKLNLTLWTRSRGYQVKLQKPMRMKVVSYIRSDLRLFQALNYLPSSPLCKYILEPTKQDFSLKEMKSKTLAPLIKEDFLNPSQRQAILKITHACFMRESKLCMIQGPPGTGKSHVIVNIIMQLLYGQNNYLMQRRKNNSPRILLCAPSNAAVDELVLRLLHIRQKIEKTGRFKMVRVGNLETMNQKVREISSQELAKKDVKMNLQMRSDIESVEVEINHCKAKLNSLEQAKVKNKNKIREIQMKLSQLQRNTPIMQKDDKEMKRMERAAELKIVNGADIVATTLSSCFNSTMESLFSPDQNGVAAKCAFSCCIIDEATQSQELETLIPLMLGVTTLVLVGDAMQLPATVLSVKAKEFGLNKSLFARVQDCFEDSRSNPVQFLDVQYRMHPEICLWPNRYFYNGKLRTASNLITHRSCPVVPYCILSLEYTQNSSSMPANSGEAQLIKQLTLGILEKIKGRALSVAIITPYNNQRTMILNLLPSELQGSIEVNTIDSFQGQERDVIIISVGRTAGVGFLADSQRLNVALTRARCSLILCGNFSSLKNDFTWNILLKNAEERKVLKHVPAAISESRDELMKLVMKQ